MSNTPEDLRRTFLGLRLGGRYRLDELVDAGGMGAVFRATDERLDRPVAVKVVRVEASDEPARLRKRFIREAKLAARIQHPNVVTVHDFGTHTETERELDYIVMELLRGEDLSKWLPRQTGASPSLRADILAQATRGVAAGHRAGIVHRDVKPRNLIVLPGGDSATVVVRVVDFGIAKPHADAAEFGEITVGQGFMGSARYASPEQMQGRSDPGPESDVFSLGVVGYELLAGSPPFTEDDRTRLSQGLYVPVRSPRVLNAAIPEAVEAVLLRCLEISPRERYRDAEALGVALEEAWRVAAAAAPPEEGSERDHTELDATVVVPEDVEPDQGTLPGERRETVPTPTPARRRPGIGAWAAAAALAGVTALGGLSAMTGGSMMGVVSGLFGGRVPRELVAMETLRGGLTRGDSALATGARYDVYRYRGEPGQPLTLTLTPEGFEGALEWGRVRDGAWLPLESSTRGRAAQVAVTVADTAEYRVRVRALDPAARGRYSLAATPGARTLSTTGTVESRLGMADAGLAEGVWYEEWTFRGSPGQQVNVTLQADSFAARVEWGRMANGNWQRLDEAVSDDPGAKAQLTVTPYSDSEYRVRIRNRRERQAGLYTLRVSTGPRELQPGAEVSSRLSPAADGPDGDLPAELWAYHGAAGEPVSLSVRSSSTPVILEWGRFASGQWISSGRTTASDTSTPLRIKPRASGEYFVRVHGARPGDFGRYTLFAVAEPQPTGVVRGGETVTGTLAAGDPQVNGQYFEEWHYSGTPGGRVSIAVRSTQIDPVLTFGCWSAAGVWREVVREDDSVFSRDAEVLTQVSGSGDCLIRAQSYYGPGQSTIWAGTGTYTVSVVALGPES